jgi:hypothetical protein
MWGRTADSCLRMPLCLRLPGSCRQVLRGNELSGGSPFLLLLPPPAAPPLCSFLDHPTPICTPSWRVHRRHSCVPLSQNQHCWCHCCCCSCWSQLRSRCLPLHGLCVH